LKIKKLFDIINTESEREKKSRGYGGRRVEERSDYC